MIYYGTMTWELFWCRIEMLLLLFGLFPLLTIEGIKVKMEEEKSRINLYIMGELV